MSTEVRRSGCSISVRGDLTYPQPVYLRGDKFLLPSGTSGNILLNSGEEITLACPGAYRYVENQHVIKRVVFANVACEGESMVTGSFLGGSATFGELTCTSHPEHVAEETEERCFGDGRIIRVGYVIDNHFYTLYRSCFDRNLLSVLYVEYEQTPENGIWQTRRPNNINWIVGSFFGNLDVDRLYRRDEQRINIARIVGQELADKYLTDTHYISRGHLAAQTDFIFVNGQIASYYFINAAPQWQPFNGANWNQLEQNLRRRIAELGANTKIYTGTYGVSQLRNQHGELVDIHLAVDENNNRQLPVPLYYYKVVYDEARRQGTAFIGINNPYYTLEEALELQFCPDQCRDNKAFDWINWNPDNLSNGYSFCCTIDDFKLTVKHLPDMDVVGLFGDGNAVGMNRLLLFTALLVLGLRVKLEI